MSGVLSLANQVVGAANLVTNVGGVVGTFLQEAIPGFGPVMFRRPRKIDTIIPNVAIEETHRDRFTITNHPVELGAAITDHAFAEPAELVMRVGWSNSAGGQNGLMSIASAVGGVSGFIGGTAGRAIGTAAGFAGLGAGLIGSLTGAGGFEGYVQTVYKQVLSLQNERRPFSVVTGKRTYDNMMISEINVTTDATTEFALMMTIHLRKVILVRLATVRAQETQSEPEKTGEPTQSGDKQPIEQQIPPPAEPPPVTEKDFTAHPGTGPGTGPGESPGKGTPPQLTEEQFFGSPLAPSGSGGQTGTGSTGQAYEVRTPDGGYQVVRPGNGTELPNVNDLPPGSTVKPLYYNQSSDLTQSAVTSPTPNQPLAATPTPGANAKPPVTSGPSGANPATSGPSWLDVP